MGLGQRSFSLENYAVPFANRWPLSIVLVIRDADSAAPRRISFEPQHLTELAAINGEDDAVSARRRGASAEETWHTHRRRPVLGALAGRRLALAALEAALAHAARAAALAGQREVPRQAVQAGPGAGAQLGHGLAFDVEHLHADVLRRLAEGVVELHPS